MTLEKENEIILALDDILEEERAALLAGNLDDMFEIVKQKESLLDSFSELQGVDGQEVTDLTNKMHRNQELLDHALQGIRVVSGRLSALRRVRTSLDTYDARGTRNTIDVDKETSVEKRA